MTKPKDAAKNEFDSVHTEPQRKENSTEQSQVVELEVSELEERIAPRALLE